MQNNLIEYWCMVNFVRPNLLGSKSEFTNRFVSPINNGQCADSLAEDIKVMRFRAHTLNKLLKGFIHRCSHELIKDKIPAKIEMVLSVGLSDIQFKLYQKFIDKHDAALASGDGQTGMLDSFAMLLKLWNHPDILRGQVYRAFHPNAGEEDDGDSGGGGGGAAPALSAQGAGASASDGDVNSTGWMCKGNKQGCLFKGRLLVILMRAVGAWRCACLARTC
jgi:hypothetical protein